MKIILNKSQIDLITQRLAFEIVEKHSQLTDTVFIGLQPRGIYFSDKLVADIQNLVAPIQPLYGQLDITFYRDDVKSQLHLANATHIPFSIENKKVVLIDDVLWTGRTIRAALDALIDFGRPKHVELCVLIDRRFSRELPIQANFVGKTIDALPTEKVYVQWQQKHAATQVLIDSTTATAS